MHRGVAVLVVLLVLPFLTAGALRAGSPDDKKGAAPGHVAEDGHKSDAAKNHGDHKEKEPDVFALSLDLAIWTLVVFLILVWVLGKYAWGPLKQGLLKREESIHKALADAKHARADAEQMRAQLKAEMDGTAAKMRQMLDDARKETERSTGEMMAKAQADIHKERDRLRREMDLAREQALQELWSKTAQLATLISSKAIKRQLSEDDHRRLLDESIAELQAAGQERKRQLASV